MVILTVFSYKNSHWAFFFHKLQTETAYSVLHIWLDTVTNQESSTDLIAREAIMNF